MAVISVVFARSMAVFGLFLSVLSQTDRLCYGRKTVLSDNFQYFSVFMIQTQNIRRYLVAKKYM